MSVRKIVTGHIVYCDGKPIAMVTEKKKADALLRIAVEKKKDAYVKPITAPEERIKEIGTNIFTRLKELNETQIKNILLYRNRLVRETLEISDTQKIDQEDAWKQLLKKYKIKKMKFTEFCQWTLDVSDYLDVRR